VVNETPYTRIGRRRRLRRYDPRPSGRDDGGISRPLWPVQNRLCWRTNWPIAILLSGDAAIASEAPQFLPPQWMTSATGTGWPVGFGVEMAPLVADPSHLQPDHGDGAIRIHRSWQIHYEDF